MRIAKTLITSALLVLTSTPAAMAQPNGPGGGGWGPGSPYGRMYDPKTVETVSGEIISIDLITPARRMSPGVHLSLKTDKGETLAVHLGPQWYIDQQPLKLTKGDKVRVRGSRITFQDKPAILVAEVTKNGQTMRLRDDNGVPAWAGWRRRS
jgi:DNA-directed RNA polymerase subunit E'/Rpb7